MNKRKLFVVVCFALWGLILCPLKSAADGVQLQWYQVVDDGLNAGIGDFREMAHFKGHLYAAGWTGAITQIWRSPDGMNWVRIDVGSQMEQNGIILLKVFGNYLYAGTVNRTTGAQLWRSPDGLNWQRIVSSGFDNSNVGFYSMIEFDGYIYAGMWCDWGGQVWRTQDFQNWEKVNTNGFGNRDNVAIVCLAKFKDYLYAGTNKWTDGCEIWRTGSGTDWERVVAYGFGNKWYNDVVDDLAVFNDNIYATTSTYAGGFEIWRSSNGVNWTKPVPGGFGDPVNTKAINTTSFFTTHAGYLYDVTIQSPRAIYGGAQVWRTLDGQNWQRVSDYGFGDINNISFWRLVIFKGHMFVATMNRTFGAEIWTTMPPNQPPAAVCKNIEVLVNENCCTWIIAEDVDGGSYDPDGDSISLSIDNTGPFSIGEHYVNLTVTDQHGESDTCMATVTVLDMLPPVIENIAANPDILWPPNHKMVPVTIRTSTSDNCDEAPICRTISVSSNEPAEGIGDGDMSPDSEITGDLTVNLRAERSGIGTGRIYTITVICTDASGNSTTGTVMVAVPHNKSGKN